MKKIISIAFSLFTIFSVEANSTNIEVHNSRFAKRVNIGTIARSKPYRYECDNPSTNRQGLCGFEIELFDLACKKLNFDCRWVKMPKDVEDPMDTLFLRLLGYSPKNPHITRNPFYDLIVNSVTNMESRRKFLSFSRAIYTAKHHQVARKTLTVELDERQRITQPQKLRIVTLKASTHIGKDARALYQDMPGKIFLEAKSNSEAQKMLEEGKADVWFTWTGTDSELLASGNFERKGKDIPIVSKTLGVGTAYRPGKPGAELAFKFEQAIFELYLDGSYDEISNRYLGTSVWPQKYWPLP